MIVENWLSDLLHKINELLTGHKYGAMTLFIFIFIQRGLRSRQSWKTTLNHERIHIVQQAEIIVVSILLLFIVNLFVDISMWWAFLSPFVPAVIYATDFGWHRIKMRFSHDKSYYRTRVEREAYAHESNLNYLRERIPFRWFKNNP